MTNISCPNLVGITKFKTYKSVKLMSMFNVHNCGEAL